VHDAVGRLEQDRERRLAHELGALEEGGKRVVLHRELLAAEDEERDIGACAGGLREIPDELQCDRDTALHVARAEAVHRAVLDPPGKVLLRRNGVVVAGEDDERSAGPPLRGEKEDLVTCERTRVRRRDEREEVLADRLLVTALRGDVDELERACREALGERSPRASLQRHNPCL